MPRACADIACHEHELRMREITSTSPRGRRCTRRGWARAYLGPLKICHGLLPPPLQLLELLAGFASLLVGVLHLQADVPD